MKKIKSLGELRQLALTDPKYQKLAMISAQNLGGSPRNLSDALHWLELSSNPSEGGTEKGVVKEINFCIPLVK